LHLFFHLIQLESWFLYHIFDLLSLFDSFLLVVNLFLRMQTKYTFRSIGTMAFEEVKRRYPMESCVTVRKIKAMLSANYLDETCAVLSQRKCGVVVVKSRILRLR